MKPDRALVLEKEPFAKIAAPCPYFGTCGGCTLQDLAYADQLRLKQQRLLRVLGGLDPTLTVDVEGLPDPWRYRNKAEFTFGEAQGALTLGYHAARSFWRVVDLDDCLLLPEPVSRLMQDARRLAQETGQAAYNPRSHQGFFRYLVVRISHATGKMLACLVTTQGERAQLAQMAEELTRRHPQLASVYWGVNMKVADVAIPDELFLLRGEPYLEDRIGPFTLALHPTNFLQPTPLQAERLYARVAEWVNSAPAGAAWDLYCGIGLVGFYLSAKYGTVYGIDSDAHNLEMARLNASANRLSNLVFHAGRAEDLLANKRFWLVEAKPDLIVVDPPRSGLHARVIATLLAARPRQLVYISCNAQALVRDLTELMGGFPRYQLRRVTAFDLFPHTSHVEIAALLERA
ncbi:MAG: 23S rRNA (uracil(1939)-C(5))-methyltransferase RlmD [Candidatus Omnitrophica bacterium]|nr:23S rRNA (uracil(1939)-C(5))-methyltransferase RlmD [Candidatus Omnitrophota bacterium]